MALNFFNKFFNTQISSAVFINDVQERIDFCFFNKENNTYSVKSELFKGSAFDDKFFDTLKGILSIHQNDFGDKVALILPDSLFLTDTVKLPFIQKSALNNSLSLALDALYGKENTLKFNSFLLHQNKQHATFNVSAIKKDILSKITACFEECSIPLACTTFASNSVVNACITINPKLKNTNFILLDIQNRFSRFSFAIGGKTVGFFSLPFGLEILKTDKVVNELSLFDHTPADLLVLNAKEKAKKKNLTTIKNTLNQTNLTDSTDQDNQDFVIESDEQKIKSGVIFRRSNKKLPKFMQRPTPESENEFVFENFRIFKKWALELIRNNPEIFAFGDCHSVFVNLPENLSTFLPAESSDLSENTVNFTPLIRSDTQSHDVALELFGGFSTKKLNLKNNF